jgi:hypothetical protein
MFPEGTYLSQPCGRARAGRAQLPVVAAEGRKLVRHDVYVGKNWVLSMVIVDLPFIYGRWLFLSIRE